MLYKAGAVRHSAVLAAALLIIGYLNGCKHTPGAQMYTGRTTMLEASGPKPSALPTDVEKRLDTIVTIAASQRVMENAVETLSNLGIKTSPNEILTNTKVQRVKDTNILAVEVTLASPSDAKVSADVISAEMKKAYSELITSDLTNQRVELERQLESAQNDLKTAHKALAVYRTSSGNKHDDGEIAKLQADADAADKNYTKLKQRVADAKMEEDLAKQKAWLKTIDPAYVYPAK